MAGMEHRNPGHPVPLELFFDSLAALQMQRQDCSEASLRQGFNPKLWPSEAGIWRE